jgi:ATP-dependent DNA ligase
LALRVEGPNWEYEIKFDGDRALGIKNAGRVRLMDGIWRAEAL